MTIVTILWQEVESRLSSENKILARERSQLADLMANVQKMHEDIEKANEYDRRRQGSQIQALEVQM